MDNQRLDYLAGYRHDIDYALADGVSLVLRKLRQKISTLALNPDEQVQCDFDDEEVVASVMDLDDIDGDLVDDDESRPLTAWWWHLGKIRKLTYPAGLLPAHLKTVYEEMQNKAV